MSDGTVPSERVRKMEVAANEAFDVYRELYVYLLAQMRITGQNELTNVCRYYEGGVSSVYFWNLDDGFAGVVLLKKCKPIKYGRAQI